MTDLVPVRRALLSVSDKSGLVDFAKGLAGHGVELVSTGGTAAALRAAGLEVRDVSELTGFPEMMDGRVKTLHPAVHGGLLAVRDNAEHARAMEAHGIGGIDLVVVNLYPFEEALLRKAGYDEMIENIDIGGPAMIRSAAKNHRFVSIITDVEDYGAFAEAMAANDGRVPYALRQSLAANAYARTAAYDAAVSGWMAQQARGTPRRRAFAGKLVSEMRYGENPHQAAAFYSDGSGEGLAGVTQHQGKALSYNNINDTDAAWSWWRSSGRGRPARLSSMPTRAAWRQGRRWRKPTGGHLIATGQVLSGGIIALNQTLDAETARAISEIFTEVVIAPDVDAEALSIFGTMKNLRLLTGRLPEADAAGLTMRQVRGGYLVQDKDVGAPEGLRVVTKRAPTAQEMADLMLARVVAKHVKSNAIVYVKDGATVGVGAGQMSRVDSSRIAARKAEDMAETLGLETPLTKGSAVASDAFFPFADGLEAAAAAGATALIQPGGSMRDAEVIAGGCVGACHGLYGHAAFQALRM